METLTIQELSAYLPFSVKCHAMGEMVEGTEYDETPVPKVFTINGSFLDSHNDRFVIIENEMENSECLLEECFMLLYPLSHLTKEIEYKGERFLPKKELGLVHDVSGNKILNYRTGDEIDVLSLPYFMIQKLHEWHFDTFGLIDRGLAIDKTKKELT